MQETDEKYPTGCPTGSAVLTSAGALPARFVIHAVGPVWHGGEQGEPQMLAAAHHRCLELAAEHQCRSLAFPAISTGVYGYPIPLAACVALGEVIDFLKAPPANERQQPLRLVRFVLFNDVAFEHFSTALADLAKHA